MPQTHAGRAVQAFKRQFGRPPKTAADQSWVNAWIAGFLAGKGEPLVEEFERDMTAKQDLRKIVTPKGPQGEKRPADVIGAAVQIAQIATGEITEDSGEADDSKSKAAVELGRKGGAARAASLSKKRRGEIAREAAAKRWGK